MCLENKDIKSLQKRAGRKFVNIPLIGHLADLNSPLREKYLITYGCSSKIKSHEGKTVTRYCKRMWCNVCNPIRTAIRINNYRDELEKLQNLTMTTLTMPNCEADEIKSCIQTFRKVFKQFRNSYKKRTGLVFKGVYNFECTYNHRKRNYHPHIHIIHEGLPFEDLLFSVNGVKTVKLSNELISYWLSHNEKSSILAQDTRPCTNLIEGFKYQALSIFKIKINGKKQPFVPVAELDLIYQQLEGVRCFQPFGIRKVDKTEEQQMEELEAYVIGKPDGVYFWQRHDWHHHQSSDPLSDFIPNKKIVTLYAKLKSNEHYKSVRNSPGDSISNSEGIRKLSKPDLPNGDQTAIQRLLAKRWEESRTTQTHKS